jgi:hypothetical protein
MTDRFKQQLKDYAEGKLPAEEHAQVEQELAKLETYQKHLDEMLQEDSQSARQTAEHTMQLNPKQARRLMKRGKRKARYWSVGTVFGLLLLLSMLNSVFTSLFYQTGNPERQFAYSDVLRSAIAVTTPNIELSLSSSPANLLGMKFFGSTRKKIGSENVIVGTYSQTFRLNQMIGGSNFSYRETQNNLNLLFYLPGSSDSSLSSSEWNQLAKLPDGTVAEAYVSLDQIYKADEIAKLFTGKELDVVWHAVYIGQEELIDDVLGVTVPIGYPVYGLYHHKNGGLVSDGFTETLQLLIKYKSITRAVVPTSTIKQALHYVQENGETIYGVVVTGPAKELLKLRDTAFVKQIRVGEVRLWNWNGQQT